MREFYSSALDIVIVGFKSSLRLGFEDFLLWLSNVYFSAAVFLTLGGFGGSCGFWWYGFSRV
jgi:hypothetical protein